MRVANQGQKDERYGENEKIWCENLFLYYLLCIFATQILYQKEY